MTDPFGIPGYRRRILVSPGSRESTAALEDDLHCMVVHLGHDGEHITAVESRTERAPWNACPAAAATLAGTFVGLPIGAAPAGRAKWSNCTHLYDLAMLASGHARDPAATCFDIAVSDLIDGVSTAEIRRDGFRLHRWQLDGMKVIDPAAIAGVELTSLREWIATLEAEAAEAARLLQWACLVAHGRQMLDWDSFRPQDMPANCFAFQPGAARDSIERTGLRHDFSRGGAAPLDHFDGDHFAPGRPSPTSY